MMQMNDMKSTLMWQPVQISPENQAKINARCKTWIVRDIEEANSIEKKYEEEYYIDRISDTFQGAVITRRERPKR